MKSFMTLFCAGVLTSTLSFAQASGGSAPSAPEAAKAVQNTPATGAKTPILKNGAKFAEAKLSPKSGTKAAGTVSFTKESDGIRVVASLTGVEPGKHGFHIHEKGDCSAEDASTAGGHFNPAGSPHAAPSASVRHVGDLGNIEIKKDGTGTLKITVKNPKDFSAWADISGKSVIVHEKADDLKSQPSGDAGKRIACGLIELSPSTPH
ncbi:MAG: superoxide dismutase family protein [Chitinophagaceae bacterium]|nr:superoxide dismutase family protein [Oligoflexus sp.]